MARTINKELQTAIDKLNIAISKATKGPECPLVLVTDQKTNKKHGHEKR